LVYKTTKATLTEFDINGSVTLVTKHTRFIDSGGLMCRTQSNYSSVVTEQIIKKIQPIMRIVKYPTKGYGPYNTVISSTFPIEFATIQIPTTNWDDVRTVYDASPTVVGQCSRAYEVVSPEYSPVRDKFIDVTDIPGVQTAQLIYSFTTGQGSLSYSYISF
jgi:hypothetical protein